MSHVISRDGVRIHYEVDRPRVPRHEGSVVLLHPAGADSSIWERLGWVAPLVERGLGVIRLDARGYGRSDRAVDASRLRGGPCVDDIGRVLDAEGVAVTAIAGYSLGACHAIRFAEAHPERVCALFLGGVSVSALATQGRHLAPVDAGDPAAATATAAAQRAVALREIDAALENRSGTGAAVLRAAREVARSEPLRRPQLPDVPALIAAGDHDPTAEPWLAGALADLLTRASVLLVRGTDHMGCLASDECRAAARALVTRAWLGETS